MNLTSLKCLHSPFFLTPILFVLCITSVEADDQAAPSKHPVIIAAHESEIFKLKFSPDGKSLVSAGLGSDSKSTVLKTWNSEDGSFVSEMKGHTGEVWLTRFLKDGKTLISRDDDGTTIRWNYLTGKKIASDENEPIFYWSGAVGFNADGSVFYAGDLDVDDPRILIYPTAKPFDIEALLEGKVKLTQDNVLVGHKERVWAVAFSPDGDTIFSADKDGGMRLWKTDTHETIAAWKGRRNDYTFVSVVFSPDGKMVASANMSNNIELWDAATGRFIEDINTGGDHGHVRWPICIAFHPNGKSIVSAGFEGKILFWKVPELKE